MASVHSIARSPLQFFRDSATVQVQAALQILPVILKRSSYHQVRKYVGCKVCFRWKQIRRTGKHCIKLKDRTIKWQMKLNMGLNVKQTKENCLPLSAQQNNRVSHSSIHCCEYQNFVMIVRQLDILMEKESSQGYLKKNFENVIFVQGDSFNANC